MPLAPSIAEGFTLFEQWTFHSGIVHLHQQEKPVPGGTAEFKV